MLKKLKKIMLPLLVIFSEIFMYWQMVSENANLNLKYKLVYFIICILANVSLLIINHHLNTNKKTLCVEKLFLIISIFFGGLYMFFVPAILGTDELPHFLRPYQISVGDVVVKNIEKNETLMPKELYDFVGLKPMSSRYSKNNFLKSVDYENKVNIWNGDVTSIKYSPIPYLPQVIGFWGARLLKLSPLLTLFFVRFMNLITWIILGYYSIKLLPTKKMFALILYTSPAVLSLVSTCSGDTFVLGIILLLVSYIFNLVKTKRKLNRSDYILLSLMSIGISTYKMFYVLILVLLFLIPERCFNSKKEKIIFVILITMLGFALDFIWFTVTSISSTIGSSNVSKQIHFIISNPFRYFFILINTYINDVYYYITNLVAGSEMCYGLVRVNQLFVLSYLTLLVISYFDGISNIKISNCSKLLVVFVCLAIFILVSTALYIDWTAAKLGIGVSKIIGIQSRYFWPLVMPIVMLLPSVKYKYKSDKLIIKYSVILNGILFVNTIMSLLLVVFPKS